MNKPRVLTITTSTLLCTTLWSSPALADDDDMDAPEAEQAGEVEGGRFLLLGRECNGEEEGLETMPDSPPLDSEEPGTVGCNAWEIDIVTTAELGDGQVLQTPLLEVNYGIGDNVELTLELPYELTRIDGATSHGWGAPELGIKHRFYENESRELSFALYPQLELAIPGTAIADEEEGVTISLPLLFATRLARTGNGSVMLAANAAYNMSTETMDDSFVSAGLGVGFPVGSKLVVMMEGTTEQALRKNAADERAGMFKANLALLGAITSDLAWFGSVGRSFAGTGDEGDHTSVSLGLRVLAGGP